MMASAVLLLSLSIVTLTGAMDSPVLDECEAWNEVYDEELGECAVLASGFVVSSDPAVSDACGDEYGAANRLLLCSR